MGLNVFECQRMIEDDVENLKTIDMIHYIYLHMSLEATGGSRSGAARFLGVDPKTVSRWLNQFPGLSAKYPLGVRRKLTDEEKKKKAVMDKRYPNH